jgi:hypothetical protein
VLAPQVVVGDGVGGVDAGGVDGDLDGGVLGPLGDVEHAVRLPEPAPHAGDDGVAGLEGQAGVLGVDLPGAWERHLDAIDDARGGAQLGGVGHHDSCLVGHISSPKTRLFDSTFPSAVSAPHRRDGFRRQPSKGVTSAGPDGIV